MHVLRRMLSFAELGLSELRRRARAANETESARLHTRPCELCNRAAKFAVSRPNRYLADRSNAESLCPRVRLALLSAFVWSRKLEWVPFSPDRTEKFSGGCRSCLRWKQSRAAALEFARV